MLYVHQSLGADEEIMAAGKFHWMYTVNATLSIAFGFVIAGIIGYAAIWWDVSSTIRALWGEVPGSMFNEAFNLIVKDKGGYLKIIWSMHPSLRISMLGSILMGIISFANTMIIKVTTEVAVTNTRIIYKRGLVSRVACDIGLDRIETATVFQTITGRIFGYGRLIIRGMGVGEIFLPQLEDPVGLQRKIYDTRSLYEKNKTAPKSYEEDF